MNDCYSDHKDWRICKKEVSRWVPTPLSPPKMARKTVLLMAITDGGVQTMLEEKRK